jgi:hypothetical protein
MSRRLLIPLALCVGCSSPAAEPAAVDAGSDPDGSLDADASPSAPELAIVYRTRDAMLVDATEGVSVPLVFPPQGGFVMFVGARVKNLDPATVTVMASLRDDMNSPVLTLEMRPVQLAVGSDGWAMPADPANTFDWANLPSCPLSGATRDVYDQSYVLRVAATDGSGATAEAKLTIVPTCEAGSNGDNCRCQCKLGYSLGDPCP